MDGLFFFSPQNRKAIYSAAFNLSHAKTSNGPRRSSATPLSLCRYYNQPSCKVLPWAQILGIWQYSTDANLLESTALGVHTWKQPTNIPGQVQETRRRNNHRAFFHGYDWIMKTFCTPALPNRYDALQDDERRNMMPGDGWSNLTEAIMFWPATLAAEGWVLSSIVRIIMCRLTHSINIVYYQIRFKDHSVLIDHAMTMSLQFNNYS